MDRFDAMNAFTRVVELNSFTKAALSLNIPKATLSTQIIFLEKHLNVKLLHRSTRHVSVTREGTVYYESVKQLLADLKEAEIAVSHASRSYKGRLRVDTSGTLGRQIIVPALNDFFRCYPDIDLEIGCTDRTVDLLQEGIDCAIRGGVPLDDTLVARKLIETEPVTCATQTYLEQHGTPETLEALEHHKVVNFLSPRTGKVTGFNYIQNKKVVTIYGRRKVALNDIDACLRAGLADIGIVQLPYFSVRDHLETGRLIRVLAAYPSEKLPVHIVYLQNRNLSANVRVFVDWVVALFAKEEQLYRAQYCKKV